MARSTPTRPTNSSISSRSNIRIFWWEKIGIWSQHKHISGSAQTRNFLVGTILPLRMTPRSWMKSTRMTTWSCSQEVYWTVQQNEIYLPPILPANLATHRSFMEFRAQETKFCSLKTCTKLALASRITMTIRTSKLTTLSTSSLKNLEQSELIKAGHQPRSSRRKTRSRSS